MEFFNRENSGDPSCSDISLEMCVSDVWVGSDLVKKCYLLKHIQIVFEGIDTNVCCRFGARHQLQRNQIWSSVLARYIFANRYKHFLIPASPAKKVDVNIPLVCFGDNAKIVTDWIITVLRVAHKHGHVFGYVLSLDSQVRCLYCSTIFTGALVFACVSGPLPGDIHFFAMNTKLCITSTQIDRLGWGSFNIAIWVFPFITGLCEYYHY